MMIRGRIVLAFIMLGLFSSYCSTGTEELSTSVSTVTYLEEIIPPCLPTETNVSDPCNSFEPSDVSVLSVMNEASVWPYKEGVPSFVDILLGQGVDALTPHIVIRGVAKPDTTRCDLYPLQLANYRQTSMRRTKESSLHHYFCFLDISVKEYIVGVGPPMLTVAMHREVLLYVDDWDTEKDYILNYLEDPQTRTALAYEGKELVLFLSIPSTLAIEAWHVDGFFDTWFVLKGADGEIRAVAQDIKSALTEEQRSQLNLPLSDLITKIKRAAEERNTITAGRIGIAPTLPMLITDANYLQDFYVSVGAVYDDSDDATVLPPPVPGEGDIVPVTVPVDEGEVTVGSSVPVPGEDTTVPSPTDDAGLTVGQETTTTTVVDTTASSTVVETTTTSGVVESTTTTIAEIVTGTTTTNVVPVSTTLVPGGADNPPLVDDGSSEGDQVTTTSSTVVPSPSATSTTTLPTSDDIGPVETPVTTVVVPAVTTTSEVVENTTTTIVSGGEDDNPLVDDGASGEGQVTTTSSTAVPTVSTTSSTTTLPGGDDIGPGEDPVVAPPADDGIGSEGQADAGLAVKDG